MSNAADGEHGDRPGTGLLGNPAFRRIWLAASLSNFGSMVHAVALPFLAVTQLGASPADIAGLSAAAMLPSVVLGLAAGGLVDRLSRRKLMVAMDLGRAAVLLWVPLAAWLDVLTLGQLYVVYAAMGIQQFLFSAADQAILPDVVASRQLVAANSQLRAAEAVTEGAGFAAGGGLAQALGAPLALLVDAGSYVASALCLFGLRVERDDEADAAPAEPVVARDLRGEIAEGLRFVTADPVLLALLASGALVALGWNTLGPVYSVYVYDVLGFQPGVLGLVFAVGAASSLAGAVACTRVTERLGTGRTLVVGAALFAASVAVLPLAPGVGLFGIAVLVANQLGDGFEVVYAVNARSLRQQRTPREMIGRVSASFQVARAVAALVGIALGGALGEWLGVRVTMVAAGGLIALGALMLALAPTRRL